MKLLKSHSELIEGLTQNKSVSGHISDPNVKKVCSNCNKKGHSIETCWQNKSDRQGNYQVQHVPQHVQQSYVPPVQLQPYVRQLSYEHPVSNYIPAPIASNQSFQSIPQISFVHDYSKVMRWNNHVHKNQNPTQVGSH